MKRHAALPDHKYFRGVGEIIIRLVKQDIAETSAENHAERCPDQEIIGLLRRHPRSGVARKIHHQAPADDQAGDIGKGIPADGERPDLYKDRVNFGKDDSRKKGR